MDDFNRIDQFFSQENFNTAIQVWNRADISLTDIRHLLILPTEPVWKYRLPANTFLFTSGGEAKVLLDDRTIVLGILVCFMAARGVN